MKKTIRLSESDLHRVIKESVTKILKEKRYAWDLTDDGVDEFDMETGIPSEDTYDRFYDEYSNGDMFDQRNTQDRLNSKMSLAKQMGADRKSGNEYRQYHYKDSRNPFAEDDALNGEPLVGFSGATRFVNNGLEDAEKDIDMFDKAERRRQRAADRRWEKAADTRPLHRKGSLNRG